MPRNDVELIKFCTVQVNFQLKSTHTKLRINREEALIFISLSIEIIKKNYEEFKTYLALLGVNLV